MIEEKTVPNPGSPEAEKAGCRCPVMDNRRGQGIPTNEGVHYIMMFDCPIHGPGALKKWEAEVE